MPHYSTHEICHSQDYEKKQQNKQKQNFTAEAQYLNLKAPSNNVKMQSEKILTTQTYLFLTIQHIENETRHHRLSVDILIFYISIML